MANHTEVRERRKICALPVCADGRDEADRSGDNARDEELVIVDCRAAFSVGIDFAVGFGKVGVVCAFAWLPVWFGRLREVPFVALIEWWALGFDFFEVWVRVALYRRFGVKLSCGHLESWFALGLKMRRGTTALGLRNSVNGSGRFEEYGN